MGPERRLTGRPESAPRLVPLITSTTKPRQQSIGGLPNCFFSSVGAQFLVELCFKCLSRQKKNPPEPNPGGLEPFLCSKSIKNAQNHRFLANFGLLGPKLTKMTLKTPKNGSFWSKRGSRPLRDPIFGVLGQKNRQNHQNFDFFWVFFCLTEGVFLRKTRTKFVTSKGGALDVHKFDQF